MLSFTDERRKKKNFASLRVVPALSPLAWSRPFFEILQRSAHKLHDDNKSFQKIPTGLLNSGLPQVQLPNTLIETDSPSKTFLKMALGCYPSAGLQTKGSQHASTTVHNFNIGKSIIPFLNIPIKTVNLADVENAHKAALIGKYW